MTSALALLPRRRIVLRVESEIPQQHRLWASVIPYLLFLGGRGASKSFAGSVWALARPAGSVGLIVAPTHKNLLAGALSTLLSLAYQAKLIVSHNKQDGVITLVDGKTMLLRSLDRPELIRGATVSWLWGDELGIIGSKDAWDILIACVRGPGIRQRLVTTTPPPTGPRHWLYETFVTNAVAGIHEVIVAKSSDNPYLPEGFVEDLRREYAEGYAQRELDAEWIDVGAIEVYDVDKLNASPFPPADLVRSARGWDTAATGGSGDYCAGGLLSIDARGGLYIRDMVRGQWAPSDRDNRMLRTAEGDTKYTLVRVAQERGSAGKSQAETWIRMLSGYPVASELESGEKVVRAGPLAAQLNAGNVTITAEPGRWANYWHEGKHLTPEAARSQFRYNMSRFPQGRTKDESDALALALQAIVKRDTGISSYRRPAPKG